MIEVKDLDMAQDRDVFNGFIAAAIAGMLANPLFTEGTRSFKGTVFMEVFGDAAVNYARSAMAARNRFLDSAAARSKEGGG